MVLVIISPLLHFYFMKHKKKKNTHFTCFGELYPPQLIKTVLYITNKNKQTNKKKDLSLSGLV